MKPELKKVFIHEIESLIDNGELDKAEVILNSCEMDEHVELYLLHGKILHKKQRWGAAINVFQKVLNLDKNNKEAKLQSEIIRNILNFSNPDMFNP